MKGPPTVEGTLRAAIRAGGATPAGCFLVELRNPNLVGLIRRAVLREEGRDRAHRQIGALCRNDGCVASAHLFIEDRYAHTG